MKRLTTTLWLSLFFYAINLQAQSVFTIYVKNYENQFLEDANVILEKGNVLVDSFKTDITGKIITRGLEQGFNYSAKVSARGYNDVNRVVTFSQAEQNKVTIVIPQSAAKTFTGRSRFEETSPFDEITSEDLQRFKQYNLTQALQYLVPSFHSTHQTIADITDHIDPSSFRGLGPDQYLILVNGKRYHPSALVHVNGTTGRGAVGTDINTIPISSIERIELWKDAATTEYGSDAIAGVMNIILKGYQDINSRPFKDIQTEASVLTGITQEGDGEYIKPNFNTSVNLGSDINAHLSLEAIYRGGVNRSGEYQGNIFSESEQIERNILDTTQFDRRVMEIGSAQTLDLSGIFNATGDFDNDMTVTVFGGANRRQGEAAGFYRFPKDSSRVVSSFYPTGFLPEIHTTIVDYSGGAEVNKLFGSRFEAKLGGSYGANTISIDVENSNNASLSTSSPMSANTGELGFSQSNINLDGIYSFDEEKKYQLEVGGFLRGENYFINEAEDEEAWIDGGAETANGLDTEFGIQVFPGFRPQDEVDNSRTIYGGYLKMRAKLFNKKLLVDGGARLESYQYESFEELDTSNISIKAAFSWKAIEDKLAIRGSFNNGFRAPSLHQFFYSKVNTLFINGQAVQAVNYKNQNQVTSQFGIPSLKPENSQNFGIGMFARLNDNERSDFTLAVDFYHIRIQNRIILTGLFRAEDDPVYADILGDGIGAAQFFTNAINTSTSGLDIILSKRFQLNPPDTELGGFIDLQIAFNANTTQVDKIIGENAEERNTFFNREEVGRIESSQPDNKMIIQAQYNSTKGYWFSIRTTRFGEVEYVHPTEFSRDQIFSKKWVTDVDFSATLLDEGSSPLYKEGLVLSIGLNNVFNVYPDAHLDPANTNDGRFVYSRRVQQFGVAGRTAYVKFRYVL